MPYEQEAQISAIAEGPCDGMLVEILSSDAHCTKIAL